jgi:hypothetical protein
MTIPILEDFSLSEDNSAAIGTNNWGITEVADQ